MFNETSTSSLAKAQHLTLASTLAVAFHLAQMFNEISTSSLAKARRRGYLLMSNGQPADHPSPAAAEELRYLKFNVLQLEG